MALLAEQPLELNYSNNIWDRCTSNHEESRTTLYFPFLKPKNKSRNLWEKKKKNAISTTFLQQILSGRLLLVVISGQKSTLSCGFKLEPVTIYHMRFVVKML